MAEVQLTKLEVAERQLCQAIRLFFGRGDEVSTHTLIGAASQVLRDLAKRKSIEGLFRGSISVYIREEKQQEVLRRLDHPRNFFKHADRDGDETLLFNSEQTPWHTWEAVHVHQALTGECLPETLAFTLWLHFRHPDILLEGPIQDIFKSPDAATIDTNDFDFFLLVIDCFRATQGERFRLPIQVPPSWPLMVDLSRYRRHA